MVFAPSQTVAAIADDRHHSQQNQVGRVSGGIQSNVGPYVTETYRPVATPAQQPMITLPAQQQQTQQVSIPVTTPELVGREFVRQYYTMMGQNPEALYRFYSSDSMSVFNGQDLIVGPEPFLKRINLMQIKNCHTKIRTFDALETIGKALLIHVIGEHSINGATPYRRFAQTFVLAQRTERKYYVLSDVFRYLDGCFVENSLIHETDVVAKHDTLKASMVNGSVHEDDMNNNLIMQANAYAPQPLPRKMIANVGMTTTTVQQQHAPPSSSSGSLTTTTSSSPEWSPPAIANNTQATIAIAQQKLPAVTAVEATPSENHSTGLQQQHVSSLPPRSAQAFEHVQQKPSAAAPKALPPQAAQHTAVKPSSVVPPPVGQQQTTSHQNQQGQLALSPKTTVNDSTTSSTKNGPVTSGTKVESTISVVTSGQGEELKKSGPQEPPSWANKVAGGKPSSVKTTSLVKQTDTTTTVSAMSSVTIPLSSTPAATFASGNSPQQHAHSQNEMPTTTCASSGVTGNNEPPLVDGHRTSSYSNKQDPSYQIHVSHYPEKTTKDELWHAFEPYGKVIDVVLKKSIHRATFPQRDYAFVTFDNVETVEKLITMKQISMHDGAYILLIDRRHEGGSRFDPHSRGGMGGGRGTRGGTTASYRPPRSSGSGHQYYVGSGNRLSYQTRNSFGGNHGSSQSYNSAHPNQSINNNNHKQHHTSPPPNSGVGAN